MNRAPLSERVVGALFLAVNFVAGLLPIGALFVLGGWIGRAAWCVLPGVRRVTLRNLRIAFEGEKSARELRRLGREHLRLLCANLLTSLKLARMDGAAIRARVGLDIDESVAVRRAAGREPWIAAISHLGNWEIYPHLRDFIPEYEAGVIYQPLRNRRIDAFIAQIRARSGVRLFDRRTAMLAAARFLKTPAGLAILVDQNAGDHGVWAPLFGRLASTTPLAATLAEHAGAVIVPIAVHTTGVARWRLTVSPAIETAGRPAIEVAAEMNRVLEKQIRVSPADWLWSHDRWKTPPHFLPTAGRIHAPSPGMLQKFRVLIVTDNDAPAVSVSQQAVRAIRQSRPDAHITVTSPAGLAPAWQAPGVDAFVPGLPRDARFDAAFVFATKTPRWLRRVARTVLATGDDPHAPADLTQARLRLIHRAGGIT